MKNQIKTLIIDNYDSFTNNLFQYVAEINNIEPILIKNDSYSLDEVLNFEFDNIIISPGPGRADLVADFGICADLIRTVNTPILGVCLGHQGIGYVYGAEIIHAPNPVHGQEYLIKHNNDSLFMNIPTEFEVVRYHSLIVNYATLPNIFEVTAITADNLIMALKHKNKPIWGVQFHPESINTQYGYKILENFMLNTKTYRPNLHLSLANIPHQKVAYEMTLAKNTKTNLKSKKFSLLCKKLNELYSDSKLCELLEPCVADLVWLDSNNKESDSSRFSIIACLDGPLSYKVSYTVCDNTITIEKNNKLTNYKMTIFDFIKSELENIQINSVELPFNFRCGFIGYFGYELYKDTLNIELNTKSEYPDAQFLFVDRAIIFDKISKNTFLLTLCDNQNLPNAELWLENTVKKLENTKLKKEREFTKSKLNDAVILKLKKDKQQYIKDINTCLDYIKDGESYEICLTNKAIYHKKIDPLTYYLYLRKVSQTPFSAFLKFNELAICSASMERFLYIDKDKNVQTKPIKGTLPRGKNYTEDLQLIEKLRNDKKFKSENLMIVDLLRNDLGGVCEIGSVYVKKLMEVESYSTVHQLVSTICGKLRQELSPIDCIKAAFPGGSMVGAPKKRTIKILDNIEKEARGIYSGALGYISLNGCVDLNIVIRTAVITPEQVSIGVGGAIIALSSSEEEFEEINLKLKLLKKALIEVA